MDATRAGTPTTVLPANRIKATGEMIRVGQPVPVEPCGVPRVQLVREADIVRVIEITCSCGEVIRVQCEYS